MPDQVTLITVLEDLLVREFRACQNLHALTKEERQALVENDLAALASVAEHKESFLDELGQLDDQRRMVVQDLAIQLGNCTPTIAAISAALPGHTGSRLNRLREGFLALTSEIRDLTGGNRALVMAAMERADALQSFLLDLFRPNLIYQPPGAPVQVDAGAALGIDQRL